MERIVLSDPIVQPEIRTTDFTLAALYFQVFPVPALSVHMVGTNGERKEIRYEAEQGATILRALNTADLSAMSMTKRILAKLVQDGHFTGTIAD